jgi:hypothetical protein
MSAPVPAPSLEEMRELYTAATQFQAMACWDWMADNDIFGVQNPETGEVGYCCVMGQAGEFFALGVYLGSEGLKTHMQIQSGQAPDDPIETLMTQKCLMASFEDREMVEKEDREVMKQLGLKFRGRNAWPLFRSYRPGYHPWFVTAEEARFLTLALQQTLEVAPRFKANPRLLAPSRGKYLVRVPERSGDGWTWHDERLAPAPLQASEKSAPGAVVDAARLQHLQETAAPTTGILEMDFAYSPTPVKEKGDERPYYPYLVMAADHDSGFVLNVDLVPPRELPSRFAENLLGILENMQKLPREVRVRSAEAFALLEPVTAPLKVRLKTVRRLDALDAAREELAMFLG